MQSGESSMRRAQLVAMLAQKLDTVAEEVDNEACSDLAELREESLREEQEPSQFLRNTKLHDQQEALALKIASLRKEEESVRHAESEDYKMLQSEVSQMQL